MTQCYPIVFLLVPDLLPSTSARRVLILMGGEDVATLIKRALESEYFWGRHGGLKWAFIRGDDGIIQRLAAIATPRRPA